MATTILDAPQVLKKVYDEATESLKVNATVVAQDITLIVDIDEADDSILVYGNDGTTNRAIRTNSIGVLAIQDNGGSITVDSIDLDIRDLNASQDNIAISDGADTLQINADGSINVNITPSTTVPKTPVNTYNEIASLASGSEVNIVTYTAPIGVVTYLLSVEVAGTNIATYRILKNATVLAKKYTYFGDGFNADFDFRTDVLEAPGIRLTAGDVISVKVIHNRPSPGDFNARIETIEVG